MPQKLSSAGVGKRDMDLRGKEKRSLTSKVGGGKNSGNRFESNINPRKPSAKRNLRRGPLLHSQTSSSKLQQFTGLQKGK